MKNKAYFSKNKAYFSQGRGTSPAEKDHNSTTKSGFWTTSQGQKSRAVQLQNGPFLVCGHFGPDLCSFYPGLWSLSAWSVLIFSWSVALVCAHFFLVCGHFGPGLWPWSVVIFSWSVVHFAMFVVWFCASHFDRDFQPSLEEMEV